MELTNEFTVPTDIDTAWATLTDLEKVAPCLPGATLEEVDGRAYKGRVKVKVGPITVTYQGTAEIVEADEEKRRARVEAAGRETRGAGIAKAEVMAELTETEDGVLVKVTTNLDVTGKPAQFGRGVMIEVGTKIVDAFAERLEALVLDDQVAVKEAKTPATSGAWAVPIAEGPRQIPQDPSRRDDVLDLMDVARAATVKRLIPLFAALAVVGLIVWFTRRGEGAVDPREDC